MRLKAICSWVSLIILIAFYTHGVTAASLVFPRLSFDENSLTGLAIANLSEEVAVITLNAYGENGAPIEAPDFVNPASLTIEPGEQVSRLLTEIFGTALPPQRFGWIQLTSPTEEITGFFLFLDVGLIQFDGADLPKAAEQIVFNVVRAGNDFSTELSLINTSEGDNEVLLSLHQPGAEVIGKSLQMPPRAVARFDAVQFFEIDAVVPGSYVRALASGGPVAGFEFVRTAKGDLLGLNAKDAAEQLELIYFPQMIVQGGWKTDLGIVNYSDKAVLVDIFARGPAGALYGPDSVLANPVTRGLEPGESLTADVAELFGFAGTDPIGGWLEAKASSPSINGYLSYGIPAQGSLAAIAGAPVASRRAVFPHIATASGFFTGLAVLNPSSLTANVRVVALTPDGTVLGSADTVLRPKQRSSQLLTELVPAAENQNGGLFWVQSEVPFYASSLFGTGSVLANVPPQEAPIGYQPDRDIPKLLVEPRIAVVQPGRAQTFSATGSSGEIRWLVNGLPGGSDDSGTIDGNGFYVAPAERPPSSLISIVAESDETRGGASVDVLEISEFLGGLGTLQAVVYHSSLQKLYEAELVSAAGLEGRSSPASSSGSQSELFEVVSASVRTSVRSFDDNVVKLLSYPASNGQEYILILAQESGTLIRFDPVTDEARVVYTGLDVPTSMALNSLTGEVVIAESDRVLEIGRSFIETGLTGTSPAFARGPGGGDLDGVTIIPVTGAAGVAFDSCTGDTYYSDSEEGVIRRYSPATDETTDVVTGLANPGQIMVVYREGMPCPEAAHILVAEEGAERIVLIAPHLSTVVAWIDAPGIRDLTFLPNGNPLLSSASVAFGRFVGFEGLVDVVAIGEQYGDPPSRAEDPCASPLSFDDPQLELIIREKLALTEEDSITCTAVEGILDLSASDRGILRLDGIEFLKNLQTLDVSHNQIEDLSPISSLFELRELDASFNVVQSIGLLANLGELVSLDLSHNLISDLSTISEVRIEASQAGNHRAGEAATALPSLRDLDLSHNRIEELRPLGVLDSIQILRLPDNEVGNVESLKTLTRLAILDLGGNQIVDPIPLLLNPGLGDGDLISLAGNPIHPANCNAIEELRARGIEVDLEIPCSIDLAVTLTEQDSAGGSGKHMLFHLEVVNLGTEPAERAVATVHFPPQSSVEDITQSGGSCTFTGSQATCVWTQIDPGTSVGALVQAEIHGGPGSHTARAEVAARQSERIIENNFDELSIVLSGSDLVLTKQALSDPAFRGGVLAYSIQVTNEGPETATGVTVTDVFPEGVSYVSSTLPNCSENPPGILVCSIGQLDMGQTVAGTVTVNVETSVDLNATASVSADQSDPDPDNNSATVETPVEEVSDLKLTKTASASELLPNSEIVYTLQITNDGPSPATNVIVSDAVPGDIVVGSGETSSVCEVETATNQVTCSLGMLTSGSSATVTIGGSFGSSPETSLTNTAMVAADQTDPDTTNNSDSVMVRTLQAELSISKSVSPQIAVTGTNLVYTLQVTNSGPDAANNVEIIDMLPPATTYIAASSSPACSLVPGSNPAVVECTVGSIAPGASVLSILTVSVESTEGSISNTASVSSDEFDPDLNNNSETVETPVEEKADLQLSKTASVSELLPNSQIVYTIEVTNSGPSPATNVTMTDAVPGDIAVGSAEPDSDCVLDSGANQVTCSLGTLSPGSSVTVTIGGSFGSSLETSLTNTANVAGDQTDPDTTNNSDSSMVRILQADLSVSQSDSADPVVPGGTLQYSATILNQGPDEAVNVRILDTTPAGVPICGFTLPGGSCTQTAGGLNCTVSTLAAGSAATLQVNVCPIPSSSSVLTNTVSATSDPVDPNPADNSVVEDTSIATADLSISKSAAPQTAVTGTDLVYTLSAVNNGPDQADNVSILDSLPAATTYIGAASSPACSPVPGSSPAVVECAVGTLPAGGSIQVTIAVSVESMETTISNSATVSSEEFDPDASNDSATTITPVMQVIDLSVAKTAIPVAVIPDHDVLYMVTVVNDGPSPAAGVQLTDTLPSQVLFVSAIPSQGSCSFNAGSHAVECSLGEIGAGASAQVSITATHDSKSPGRTLENTVSVAANGTDSDTANNSFTLLSPLAEADLSVVISDKADPIAGSDPVELTAQVTNLGQDAATSVWMTFFPLNSLTVFTSAVPSQGSCVVSPSSVSCDIGALTMGSTATVELMGNPVVQNQTVSNRVIVGSDELDPAAANNTATENTFVNPN